MEQTRRKKAVILIISRILAGKRLFLQEPLQNISKFILLNSLGVDVKF